MIASSQTSATLFSHSRNRPPQCLFGGGVVVPPKAGDSISRDSQFSFPVSLDHPAALVSDPDGRPLVTGLLGVGFPTAIPRFVGLIVIDSTQSQARWAFTHVREERLKALAPLLADRDSPTAVAFVTILLGVVATLLGPNPSPISACPASPSSVSVRFWLQLRAPARNGRPSLQAGGNDADFPTAPAPTQPCRALAYAIGGMKRQESAKLTAGQIFYSPHAQLRFAFSAM